MTCRIDTIGLDLVARRYEAFLRAVRMLRGLAAILLGKALSISLVAPPVLYAFPGDVGRCFLAPAPLCGFA
jgi:hypothetical protein